MGIMLSFLETNLLSLLHLLRLYMFFIVLPTARMGSVNGEARATLLCVDTDRHRRESTLLRLYVLQ